MAMPAPKLDKLPGTRPAGARDEHESAARVREMFTRIAPRYDFLNHFLSFSLDHLWRRRAARRFAGVLRRPDARILDLCCGTGDLAFAFAKAREADGDAVAAEKSKRRAPVLGADFAEAMLIRARDKAIRTHRAVAFAAADALQLPFPDASFDLVATAFGFRNLANYEGGLREIARVLKPGGQAGILEFSEPSEGLMAGLFRFYFQRILPRIGGAISGNREAYSYLPGSVAKFPSPEELSALMGEAGFVDIQIAYWNFRSVILHSAVRH